MHGNTRKSKGSAQTSSAIGKVNEIVFHPRELACISGLVLVPRFAATPGKRAIF
jgi:hypothetical protein